MRYFHLSTVATALSLSMGAFAQGTSGGSFCWLQWNGFRLLDGLR
jgi:hypothetical protein